MRTGSEIVDDKRPILCLTWEDEAGTEITTGGKYAVDEIVAYEEPGVGAMMPFFKAIKDGQIIHRVPAWRVTVTYKT